MDWQARQRALKAKDREEKARNANMLHGYRGTTDPAAKLTSIKTEDRKKQMESREYLHTYHASIDDVKATMTRGADKATRNKNAQPLPNTAETETTITEEESRGISVAETTASFESGGSPKNQVTTNAAVAPTDATEDALLSPPQSLGDSMVVVENDSGSSDDWVAVQTPEDPAPPAVVTDRAAVDIGIPTDKTAESAGLKGDALKVTTTQSIAFSFALITNEFETGKMQRYGKAIDEVMSAKGFSLHPCLMRHYEQDFGYMDAQGRANTKRFVVRGELQGEASIELKVPVLDALRSSVNDGSLLSVTRGV